ncbi:AAA domain-containing protein [Streptomyces sp. NPDC051896]|uniref:AAA domain-containing protein n=1 Tax=Streptomyces sp. NPDC051896 TaxID=3155416 RepID=UPI0034370B0F
MTLGRGNRILEGRFRLDGGGEPAESGSTLWLTKDASGVSRLAQTWPDRSQARADWTRTTDLLREFSALPESEKTLLTYHAGGLESGHGILVYESPGGHRLSTLLADRRRYAWLDASDFRRRAEMWLVLRALAQGLELIHDQAVLHRSVSAETCFVSPVLGAGSLRLGGFAHAVRLGEPISSVPDSWATDPYSSVPGRPDLPLYGTQQDWYAFGMLAARCLTDIEHLGGRTPHDRATAAADAVRHASHLQDAERDLLLWLLAPGDERRFVDAHRLAAEIDICLKGVRRQSRTRQTQVPTGDSLLLLIDPDDQEVAAAVARAQRPATVQRDPTGSGSLSGEQLIAEVQADLDRHGVLLTSLGREAGIVLSGTHLDLRIEPGLRGEPSAAVGVASSGWSAAVCRGTVPFPVIPTTRPGVPVPSKVTVRSSRQPVTDDDLSHHLSWGPYIPVNRPADPVPRRFEIIEALRLAAQVELLLHDADTFAYEMTERRDGPVRYAVLRNTPRAVEPLDFLRDQGTMSRRYEQRLRRRLGRTSSIPVLLCADDGSAVDTPKGGAVTGWRVDRADIASDTVRVVCEDPSAPAVPATGTIRSVEAGGQHQLVLRRQRHLDTLGRHLYLLRAMTSPGALRTLGRHQPTPPAISVDAADFDESKQAVLADVLAADPLYSLQGPPGTGKTTFVARLIHHILRERPHARILVAAQSHAAVEVLMDRTEEVCASGPTGPGKAAEPPTPTDDTALLLRMGTRSEDGETQDVGTGPEKAVELLQGVLAHWEEPPAGSPYAAVRLAWQDACNDTLDEYEREPLSRLSHRRRFWSFVRLLELSANVAFCTSSAPDLDMPDGRHRYDWCVLEEAGKIHGFELCAPLTAARRWLLIGDTAQLPPFRLADFEMALRRPNDAIEALRALHAHNDDLIDRDLIRRWDGLSDRDRAELVGECRRWLRPFSDLQLRCTTATGRRTRDRPNGAMTGVLTTQHRMHPTIGGLVSSVYYGGQLRNGTWEPVTTGADRKPLRRVRHGIVQPPQLADRAVVWLDTGALGEVAREWGPSQGFSEYANPAEAVALRNLLRRLRADTAGELRYAFLAPYQEQVRLLSWLLARTPGLPAGLRPAAAARHATRHGVHTVDSFQGNQADLIFVSLTRNNDRPSGTGLGFMRQAERMNVLVSRAERLLVLAGSWPFFVEQTRRVRPGDRGDPMWHWHSLLTTLGEGIRDGWAVRLPADVGRRPGRSMNSLMRRVSADGRT